MSKSANNDFVLSNPLGNKVEFRNVDNSDFINEKKYTEVFFSNASLVTGNILQGALQIGNQSYTLTNIASQAKNGLFTSTINPNSLSKFKDGTVSTMVRDSSGKLTKHSGFTEVGLGLNMNPAMALSVGMQAMSLISGTYYLNQINNQIAKMDNKLDELIQIHHDTNIGKLKSVKKGLSEIAKRNNVDIVDVNAIRNFKQTSEEIYEEYVYSLNRKESELSQLKSVKEEIVNDLNYCMGVAFEANKLSLFADLIEIGTRMKIGGQSSIIIELTEQLEKNYNNSFYINIDEEINNVKLNIEKRLDEILLLKNETTQKIDKYGKFVAAVPSKATVMIKSAVDSKNYNKNKEKYGENLKTLQLNLKLSKKSESFDNLVQDIIKLPSKENEVLYMIDGENQRVFIPENGNS